MDDVAIIGGGTMGMTLAYRLSKAGCCVTVFEKSKQLGGLSTWFDYGEFSWDKYYHVICSADSELLGLIDEMGLTPEMKWTATKTGFLWRGLLLSMSSNLEFLTFPPLSLWDKVRLAWGILRCRRIPASQELEATKASDWLTQLFGKRVYEAIWEPLLESKYGSVKDTVPATIMWATINRYYSTRNKGDGREKLGCLRNSLRSLYEALGNEIRKSGGSLICNASVDSIDLSDASRVSINANGKAWHFDRVISTLPTRLLQEMLPEMENPYSKDASPPRFLGAICMAMVLKKPLTEFYVTNLIQKGLPFTGIIEVSNLCGSEALNGRHLVILPRYDVPDSCWFDKPDREIAKAFIDALKPVFPEIDDMILESHVHRERKIQALWIESPPPPVLEPWVSRDGRIWSINAELTGRDTLNNNAVVRVANRVAKDFLRHTPVESFKESMLNSDSCEPAPLSAS